MEAMDYTDEAATFGDRLMAAREAAGIKRKKLAQQIGVKPSTLRNWEDDRSEPRANRLTVLSGILGVSLVWLMTGEGAGPVEPETDGPEEDRALAALAADFVATRAEMVAVGARMAGIERRLKRLAQQ